MGRSRIETANALTVKVGDVVKIGEEFREVGNMYTLLGGRKRLIFTDGSMYTLGKTSTLNAHRLE